MRERVCPAPVATTVRNAPCAQFARIRVDASVNEQRALEQEGDSALEGERAYRSANNLLDAFAGRLNLGLDQAEIRGAAARLVGKVEVQADFVAHLDEFHQVNARLASNQRIERRIAADHIGCGQAIFMLNLGHAQRLAQRDFDIVAQEQDRDVCRIGKHMERLMKAMCAEMASGRLEKLSEISVTKIC